MKIKSKFIVVVVIISILLILFAWLAIGNANKGFLNLSNVHEDSKEVQVLETKYLEPLYRVRELTLTLSIAPNEELRKEFYTQIYLDIKQLDKNFNELDVDNNLVWKNYKKLLFLTIEYIKNSFEEGAFINITTVERKQFTYLINRLKKIQEEKILESQKTFIEARDELINYKRYIILSIILIFIISIFIGYLVSEKIVSAISKVEHGLEEFFTFLHNPNKNKNNILIDVQNNDELGKMARRINIEIELIRKEVKKNYIFIEEVIYIIKEIKEDKLNNRLKSNIHSEEFSKLKALINEMLDNLENRIEKEIGVRLNHEKLLIQQSKLAEMGNMIGNIAHQWRQPLSEINAIILELKLAMMYDKLDPKYINKQYDDCFTITKYMSNTISDFQNFFQPSKEKKEFSLIKSCKNAISIIQSSLKFYNIEIIFDHGEDHLVIGYPNEFSQALLNLLSNAKDILIERKIEKPSIHLHLNKEKQYSLIQVKDNAGGIKIKNIEQVFEPYFTTKHAKQGTGIGLYMTKTIIENNMNGFVNVKNTKEGACFTIKIK